MRDVFTECIIRKKERSGRLCSISNTGYTAGQIGFRRSGVKPENKFPVDTDTIGLEHTLITMVLNVP